MYRQPPLAQIAAFNEIHGKTLPQDEFAVAVMLAESGIFDGEYYARLYKDVDASHLDPVIHYLRHKHARVRKPVPWFDGAFYLKKYPDVAESGVNPFLHYLLHGWGEGRRPNADFQEHASLGTSPPRPNGTSRRP